MKRSSSRCALTASFQTRRVYAVAVAVALAGCAVPLGFDLEHHRDQCGPHQGACMKDALTALISSAPRRASPCILSHAMARQDDHMKD